MRQIAVYGGGDWSVGDEFWGLGVAVGRLIVSAGAVPVTGGYGGAMEAVSQGASQAGGSPIGILHRPASEKPGNPYLGDQIIAMDYQDRMAHLLRIEEAIALPGFSGTHAEIAAFFALMSRHGGRRLALWSNWWRPRLEELLIEMSHGHSSGVEWIADMKHMKRWIQRGVEVEEGEQ